MAQPKMKKAPPPPCTSSPTDPPVESPLPVSDIEVPESQSDIITGTPSVSQAPAENQLVKQLPTLQTTQINPQKNASRRATSGTISSRRAQRADLCFSSISGGKATRQCCCCQKPR
ncbi:hypothetical protein PSTT_04067, partial [Puccinia striiformis]